MRAVAPFLVAALAASACSGAGPGLRAGPSTPCDEGWAHVTVLLHRALDEYLEGMRRFAVARDGASTAPAEARARARAAEWEAAQRPGFEKVCRAFSPEEARCVREAASARELPGCGLEPLVTSFTDEVVAAFAANPLY
jgi:hypothetical protein